MPVSREEPPPVYLREPPEPLVLQPVHGALQLRKVLLDPSVGQIGQGLRVKSFHDRIQSAHVVEPGLCAYEHMFGSRGMDRTSDVTRVTIEGSPVRGDLRRFSVLTEGFPAASRREPPRVGGNPT